MGSKNLVRDIRFASHGRSWMILLCGRRGLAVDRWLVGWTGLSLVSLQYALAGGERYVPVLLLTTIGAKSGELRTVVLPYLEWKGRYVVIGSNAGGPTDPHWVGNIRSNAHCWVRVGRRRMATLGHVAGGEEYEELSRFVTQNKPNVARYQQRASGYGREIPLVVLSPHR